MKKINRILVLVLSVTLLITCSNSANLFHAAETGGQDVSASVIGEDDLIVEGTNSFGSLLAEELVTELEEQEENNGCNIFSIEMQGNVAEISFETTEYATIVVGIYDNEGTEMLALGKLEVVPKETVAYVEIDIETMPEYYYVRGFLIEEESMRPMCNAYESSLYTKEMQEFLAKTTDDFDADRVLNFDEDKTNNFAVYSEDTILIPESGEKNRVTKSDDENSTYVIENIDSHISSLKLGDIFAYEYGEENILIVKVATISINGTTATITGEETSMEEVFEYVKIDECSNAQDVTVDESTCGEGVTYKGKVEVEVDSDMPQTYAYVDGGEGEKFEDEFALNLEYEKNDVKVKITGSVGLELIASVKVYFSWDIQFIEVKIDYSSRIAISVTGELPEISIPTGYFNISPIPAVFIGVTPELVLEVSAKVELNGQLYGTIGFSLSSEEGKRNLTTNPIFKPEIVGEITVFVGYSIGPEIRIIDNKIVNVSVETKVGGEVKGELAYSTVSDDTPDLPKIHKCEHCVKGEINAKASITFKANFFNWKKLNCEISASWSIKAFDFYHSYDNGGFALTTCPHYKYKVIFTVKGDLNKKNLSGARIAVEGTEITTITEDGKREDVSWITTDENGKAEGYLSAGKYNAMIEVVGFDLESKKFAIENNPVSVVAFMDLHQDEEDDDTEDTEDTEDDDSNWWEDDDIGENEDIVIEKKNIWTCNGRTGVITADGSLYMWGYNAYGEIGNGTTDSQLIPIKVLDNVEEITLGNSVTGAITTDGSLYIWGDNSTGQIGNGTRENQLTPIKILDDVIDVIIETNYTGAITADGSLYMWGYNGNGQIGNGTTIYYQDTPTKVLENVAEVISVGLSSVGAITTDGSLYMWGENEYGQVGNGNLKDQRSPIKVLDNVVQVVESYNNIGAITADGNLYIWGNNRYGQIGNGSNQNQLTPEKVLEGVVEVVMSDDTVGAITIDGSLYMWGYNRYGQIGNGSSQDQFVPEKVLTGVTKVVMEGNAIGAITEEKNLYMWGYIVGNDSKVYYPEKVLDNVIEVVTDGTTVGAITKDGSLYMWGSNISGQIGNGTTEHQLTPLKIMDNVIKVVVAGGRSSSTSVSSSDVYAGALTEDGSLYIWGYNGAGQVGNGITDYQLIPLKVLDNLRISEASQRYESQQIMLLNSHATYTTRNITQQADYANLLPNTTYNFYVMKDKSIKNPLDSANLLYITQGVSDASGNLSISYEPTQLVDDADIFVVQMAQADLSSAEVKLENLKYTGELQYVHPTVTLDGTVLTEGKEYELLGAYSALEEGEYTVTVNGIGLYTGEINITYHVYSDEAMCLIQALEDAEHGTTVQVTMKTSSLLPQRVLELAREKEITLVIILNDGTIWKIKGADISDGELHDTDVFVLKTTKENGNISTDVIDDLASERTAEQLIFTYKEDFNFNGELTLEMSEDISANKAVLFQADASNSALKMADSALITDNTIAFDVTKGTDGAIIYGFNGDINVDKKVTIKDMMLMLHSISGRATLNEIQSGFADVDMNNVVNLQDLMRELRYVSGRTDSLCEAQ